MTLNRHICSRNNAAEYIKLSHIRKQNVVIT